MDEIIDCNICNIIHNGEKRLYEDDGVIIVEAKNKKSHITRLMAFSKYHTTNYDSYLVTYLHRHLINEFRKLSNEDFIIWLATRRTEQHLHFVASDLNGDDMSLASTEPVLFVKNNV